METRRDRILLLVGEERERALLAQWLGRSYDLVRGGEAELDRQFDLAVADAPSLARLAGRVHARRQEEAPCVLPFVLLLPGRAPSALEVRRVFDEVLRLPLDRNELQIRIETLLRMRHLSLEMRQRTGELSERLGRILDDSLSEIYVLDARTLRFVQVNRQACRNLGCSAEELLALTPLEIEAAPFRRYGDLLSLGHDGQPERRIFETEHQRRDGTRYPVEVRLRLSHAESSPVFVAVVEDISERKEAEKQIEKAHERALRAEVDRQDFSRQLLRSVTHDRFQLVDPADIPDEGEPVLDLPVRDGPEYRTARDALRETALASGMAEETVDDLLLATGEAIGNCLKHASDGRCRVYRMPDRLAVRVSDRGAGIRWEDLPATILTPGFSTKGSLGMGYTLMLKLLNRIWLSTTPHGTIIQMEKRLHPDPEADDLEYLLQVMDRF